MVQENEKGDRGWIVMSGVSRPWVNMDGIGTK